MRKINCIIAALLVVCTLIFSGCSSNSGTSAQKATASTDPTVKTTGQKIKINDSTLGEIWITVLDGVPVNTINNSGFTSDSTYKYYAESGSPASMEGVDISSYNGTINWKKVKASGIDFVMIRIGGRGYGDDGALYSDDKAIENIKGAQAVGIKAGVYFFSQAITDKEAVEEADYIKTLLGDTKIDFPVAYDWEIIKDDDARTDSVSAQQATSCARAFCDRVKKNGYTPLIYSPSSELYFKYDLQQLADVGLWYCEYSDTPTFYYQFSMWQYSKNGNVDGIDGETDLNICFTNIADYD